MFNLLKMDIRRLFKTRSFYIVLAVTAALFVMLVALVSAASDPEKLDTLKNTGMVVTDTTSQGMQEELRGMDQMDFLYECIHSGFLLMIGCIGVTLFVHSDFSSGYIKNICFARPRRWEYVLSKIWVAGIYSGILTASSTLVSLVCAVLFGLDLEPSPIAGILQYAFWLWLLNWAFALLALALVLLTRGSTLGIIMAVVSGGGLDAVLLQNLCRRFGWHDLAQYLLSMVSSQQCVPMPDTSQIAMILGCSVGWAAVYVAGSLLAMEKRDI